MGVRCYRDLDTWKLADAFKVEVHRLFEEHGARTRSWKYRHQLLDSAGAVPKDIAEGFIRYSPASFVQFLTYGLASLAEAEEWLRDGVLSQCWSAAQAAPGLLLAKRCWNAMLRLKHSQELELERRRQQRHRDRPRRPRRRKREGTGNRRD